MVTEEIMSNTATQIDAISSLNGWLQGLTGMYVADITAIPDDKLDWCPGGCARTAKSITTEVIGMCYYTAAILKGQEPSMEEMEAMSSNLGDLDTKAKMIDAFQAGTKAMSEALATADSETLNKVITPPWQMDAPVYMIAQIMVNHIWYHDGQLNYIQALLGDEKVHWMG